MYMGMRHVKIHCSSFQTAQTDKYCLHNRQKSEISCFMSIFVILNTWAICIILKMDALYWLKVSHGVGHFSVECITS